ncbi:MAG TPA: DNA gyrase modulator [bacterium]
MTTGRVLAGLVRRGADFAELFDERASSLLVHLEDGRVEKVLAADEAGQGLRVLTGEQTYYACSQRRGPAAARALAAELAPVLAARGKARGRRAAPPRLPFPRRSRPRSGAWTVSCARSTRRSAR